MTIHTPNLASNLAASPDQAPTRDDAATALAVLRNWADTASAGDIAGLDPQLSALLAGQGAPAPSRTYPQAFRATDAYRATLPDLQNGPASLIVGARVAIQHVGISNFRLPVRYARKDGSEITLETSVTGSVSLEADKKGINMSRILRSFYAHAGAAQGWDLVEAALGGYLDDLGSLEARVMLRVSWPEQVASLRSGLSGWQYYDVAFEMVIAGGVRRRFVHLDYVYSSTCPCSLELAEHARATRGQLATPHSQRSVARLSVEVLAGGVPVEDLISLARTAVPTETQVMVKREDEQAFAELNAANPMFVEDAARSFCAGLSGHPGVGDFRVLASHQESLHSHDAVSVLTQGATFASASLDPVLFQTLIHTR